MKNYKPYDFTLVLLLWMILADLGMLLSFLGVIHYDTLGQWFVTMSLICVFEVVAFFTWKWTGLYDPTSDRIKTDEESKIVPLDYVKLLLGMRL